MVLLLGAVAAFAACTVGGLVGFATSLLLLPVLLLLDVPLSDAVAVNLALAVLTRIPSVVVLRAHVDARRTGTMLVGSVPGIAVGLWLADVVPVSGLEVAAGASVLASGIYLRMARAAEPDAGSARSGAAAVAGACSGVLAVTTSLNGIPPAVLLARSGSSVRTRLADLSVFFAVGNCLVLGAIAATGGLSLALGAPTVGAWLVAGLAGNLVGLRLAGSVDDTVFASLTTWLVLGSGAGSLVRSAVELGLPG